MTQLLAPQREPFIFDVGCAVNHFLPSAAATVLLLATLRTLYIGHYLFYGEPYDPYDMAYQSNIEDVPRTWLRPDVYSVGSASH